MSRKEVNKKNFELEIKKREKETLRMNPRGL